MLTAVYTSHIYTQRPKVVQDVLILLKLMPAKSNSKDSNGIESFNAEMEKLFLYLKITPFYNVPQAIFHSMVKALVL